MSLGPDNCKKAFVDAMSPIAGDNVKLDSVQKNLGALGGAVLQIATVYAETVSDVNFDPTGFWQWITAVENWLLALSSWQQGVVQAFNNYTPTLPAEQNLRTALLGVTSPGSPPASAPNAMKGKII